jgi:hypothetical protein
MKLPKTDSLVSLIKSLKKLICDDFCAFEGDEIPGIQLTVGSDPLTGDWDYQTGDNSYSGGAYSYKDWGVVGIYRKSNSLELAREIRKQLAEAASY